MLTPRPRRTRLGKGGIVALICVPLVGGFEGLRTYAYLDPVGIPTICFGETKGVHLGMKSTVAACNDMLLPRLQEHEAGMRDCLRAPDAIPDKSYGSFVSITYNIGVGGFCHSSMRTKLDAGDLRGACNVILLYDKAHGVRLPGLTKRRREENALCLQGVAA